MKSVHRGRQRKIYNRICAFIIAMFVMFGCTVSRGLAKPTDTEVKEPVKMAEKISENHEKSNDKSMKSTAFDLSQWSYDDTPDGYVLNSYNGVEPNISIPNMADDGRDIILACIGGNKNVEHITVGTEQEKVKLKDGRKTFYDCTNLKTIDLKGLDTSKVEDMAWMFGGCSSLISLDLRGFNTSNVTNMNCMFRDCSSLKSLNVNDFNTANVIDFGHLFDGCSSLTSIDLSGFDTSNAEYMYYMFANCSGLTSIDVSNFDLSNMPNTAEMFQNCDNLRVFDLSNWDHLQYYPNFNKTHWEKMFYSDKAVPTVIIANDKELLLNGLMDGLKDSKRVPYVAEINVNNGEFKDKTDVVSNAGGNGETKKLGTGKFLYSSMDEYEKAFQFTQKEIVDMLKTPQIPSDAEYFNWKNVDTANVFEPNDQNVDFTIGHLQFLTLEPSFGKYLDVTIKYDTDGGTQIADKIVQSNSSGLLPSQNPIKSGYTFLGWEVNGKRIDNNTICADLIDITDPNAQVVVIKAIWQANANTGGTNQNNAGGTIGSKLNSGMANGSNVATSAKSLIKTGDTVSPAALAAVASVAFAMVLILWYLSRKQYTSNK